MAVIVQLNQANLAASTKTGNLLANTELANAPTDAEAYQVSVYAISSAASVNLSLQSGSQQLIVDKEIVAIGTTLSTMDHGIGDFLVLGGAPLLLTLRETAGTATTDVLLRIEAEAYEG